MPDPSVPGEPSEARANLERSLNRMVKAACEEGWTDNRIMLASAAFMTRVDAYLVPVRDVEMERLRAELVEIRAKLARVHDAAQYDDITNVTSPTCAQSRCWLHSETRSSSAMNAATSGTSQPKPSWPTSARES